MPDLSGTPPPQGPNPPFPDPPEAARSAGIFGGVRDLVFTRIGLVRLEAAEAASHALKRIVGLVAIGVLALFLWALLLAGGIGAIAALTGWSWFWVALAAAGLHLVVIGGLAALVKRKAPTAFPVTRAEFEKDSEWLDQLKQNWKG